MGETDRQTDKTTRWGFTAFEGQWDLFKTMPDLVAEWGWQTETCPETQRLHYQGYLRTKRQVRHSQARKILPGVNIRYVTKNWDALVNYCKKTESAVPGTQVHQVSTTKAMTMSDALTKLATFADNTPPDVMAHDYEKLYDKYVKQEYWKAVRKILTEEPDEIGLWSQPQYMRAWENTRTVWIKKATLEYNDASRTETQEQEREEIRSDEGCQIQHINPDTGSESEENC